LGGAWAAIWRDGAGNNCARFAGTTPFNEAAIDFSTMSLGALIAESTASATALRGNSARALYFKAATAADAFPYPFVTGRTCLQIDKDFNLGISGTRFTSISLYADVELNIAATKTFTIYNSSTLQSDGTALRTVYLKGGGTLTANGATGFANTAWNLSNGTTFNLASSGLSAALGQPVTLNNGILALGGKLFNGVLTASDNSSITATLASQVTPANLTIDMMKTLTTPGFSTTGTVTLTSSVIPNPAVVYTNILTTIALDSGLPAKVSGFYSPEWKARLSSDSLALEVYFDATTPPFNLIWNGGTSGNWSDLAWDNHGTTANFTNPDWASITNPTTITVASSVAPGKLTIDTTMGNIELTGDGTITAGSFAYLGAGTLTLGVDTATPVWSGTGTVSVATNKTFAITATSSQNLNASLEGEGKFDFNGPATFNTPFTFNGLLELSGAGTFNPAGGTDVISVETLSLPTYALSKGGWGWLKLTGAGTSGGALSISSGAIEFASGSSSTFGAFTTTAYGSNVLRINGGLTLLSFTGTGITPLSNLAQYEINSEATVLITGNLVLHNQEASTTETQQKSIWQQTGGRVLVQGTTYLGRDGKGLLNLSGGTFITPKLVLGANIGWNATDGSKRSEVNLTGGTLVLGSGGLVGSDTGYTGNNQRKLNFGGVIGTFADAAIINLDGSQVTIGMNNNTIFNTGKYDTNTFAFTSSPVTITVFNSLPATTADLAVTGPGTNRLVSAAGFGDVSIDTGSTLALDMTMTSPTITVSTFTNSGTLSVKWSGPFTEKVVYTVLSAATAPQSWGTVDFSSIVLGEGQSVVIVDSDNTKLQFMVTGNAATVTWNGGASGVWAHGSSGWLDIETQTLTTFANGDLVSFTNRSGTSVDSVVIDNAGVTPGSLFITNSATAYEFSGGAIAGPSIVVTKDGEGTAAFNSANTYSGTTTLKNGTLTYGAEGALGSSTISFAGGTLGVTAHYNATNATFTGSSYSFAIANSILLTLNYDQASSVPLTLSRFGTEGVGTITVPMTSARIFSNAMTIHQGSKLVLENTLNALPSTTVNAGVLTNGDGVCEIRSTITSGTTMRNRVYGNNTGFTGELILSGIWSRSLFEPSAVAYHETQFETYQSLGSGTITVDGQGFWITAVNNSEATRVLARLDIKGNSYFNGSSGNWYWFNGLSGNGSFSTWLGGGGAVFTGDCTDFGGTLYAAVSTHAWQFGGGSYRTAYTTPSGNLFAEGASLTNGIMKLVYTTPATNNMSLRGNASVIFDGTASGLLTFNQINTYSGTTTLTSGKLVGNSATPFGTGAITIAANSTLEALQNMTVGNITLNGKLDVNVSSMARAPMITAVNVVIDPGAKVVLKGSYPTITVGKYVTVLKATGTVPSTLPQLLDGAGQPITTIWLEWVGNELRVKSRGTMILFM
jgi:autotransporter-associated beta strand protein